MTDEKFTHLHVHSHFSQLDGLTSPKELAECASNMGYKSLALTDHGNCAGLFQFQKACKEKGIKPILGMEAYTCKDHTIKDKSDTKLNHLVLLVKNKTGYNNLIKLSSIGYKDGFYHKPRLDFGLIEKHSEGLIVSTACLAGEIPQALLADNIAKAEEIAGRYREVFKDDFYLEIMMHNYFKPEQQNKEKKVANEVFKLSKKMGIKAICTQDTHYALRDDWEAHDILLSIQTLDTIKNPDRMSFHSKDFYLKPYEEMAKLYEKAPNLLLNTVEISEKIENGVISIGEDLLPNFKVPEGFVNEEDYLKSLVKNGMERKGLMDKKEYGERIKYEMGVIIKCKYTKYFLILWDIVNFAKSQGIFMGCGRGSAAGSLCLYVLDIVSLDPIKYDLIFERFLNPDRISPPDVDMDFDYDRRDEVYDYIIKKYGSEYCCRIGTYNKFKARAVIRSTAKALDLGKDWELYIENQKKNPGVKVEMTKNSLNIADRISKEIPFKANMDLEMALKQSKEFRESIHKYPKLLENARRIEGAISSSGVHAAGILVCRDPVIERVPLKDSKGVIVSQFDGPEVEKLGLLKFDLLALKTLTVIDKTLKMVKASTGKDIDIDRLEPNDKNVFNILNGSNPTMNTLGLFQVESDGMMKLLRNIKVDRFEDIIVANALYRPGPLGAGMHDMYCDYKHGRKNVESLHPKMAEALKQTYSILVFQEDIMKISRVLAGFTRGQSDILRKCIGKKDKVLLAEMKNKFIDGCVKNNIDKEIAQKIFIQIEFFGDYGFNRSHSCSYGFICYQTGYLKYYYPLEFMCNLLTSEINNNDKNEKLDSYIYAAERMKIGCSKPSINQSGLSFKIGDIKLPSGVITKGLIKPLTILNGVGDKAVTNIVANQPYKDLEDFVKRTDGRVVNIKVFNTLVESGCMDGVWKMSNDEILRQYPEIKKKLDKDKKDRKKQEEKAKEFGGVTLMDAFNDEFGCAEKINI